MKPIFLFACILMSGMKLDAQILKYSNSNEAWNADSLGNHRVVVQFKGSGRIAHVLVNWRRRDDQPQKKAIIVTDASGQRITKVHTANVNRESGEIWFETSGGAGDYYLYYLPYKNEGRSNYPKGVYLKPAESAEASWIAKTENVPVNAVAKEIQAINAFNSFYPMEVIATKKETALLRRTNSGKGFMVFPEDRMFPIKMEKDLPYRWIERKSDYRFSATADRGEYYALQLGIYAIEDLKSVKIRFGDLKNAAGQRISATVMNCINTDGTTYDNLPLKKNVQVGKSRVQAMWCMVNIPDGQQAGTYKGHFTVQAAGFPDQMVPIELRVSGKQAIAHGLNEPVKQSRLNWLNSALAQENKVVAPYIPLKTEGNSISLLGRKLDINEDGFPKQIQTFFNTEMTGYTEKGNNILAEPIHFHFYNDAKKQEKFKAENLVLTEKTPGTVKWTANSISEHLRMDVAGSLEFDGYVHYTVKVTALADVNFSNVNFHIPFEKTAAKYLMGLGEKGGLRPDTLKWKWDVAHKNQDALWVGAVNAGLYYNLRDENYSRPLNTNFYLQKPLVLPKSWGNENKGGIQVNEKGKSILADNYTGSRSMKKGEELYFNFNLLITPFHPLNTDFQWDNRFYHKYNNLDSIKATGATVVNIHHATPVNPWINYPFIESKKMKTYIDEAHSKGLKVKIYNTVRELSNHAYELPALRSLGTEVYSAGKGGGFSWLQEHLDSNYIAAWFVPEIKDAAIINSGMNRWHNYYVEGMNWLVQQVGIDGIYLDDVAFDRVTMKRIKRVLTAGGHPGIIDLHSANQYNKSDGFNNSAILYMEHFPYLNRLWFGEYFDYQKNDPDFFLTEVSGVPFGLMGEMLQDDGNPWRGMLYGMTSRLGWSTGSDPRPLWKAWSDFGMKGSEMIGYWSENCPVKTDHAKVLATVFKKKDQVLISLASWESSDVEVALQIDWTKLGLDPGKVSISAAEIAHFQKAGNFKTGERIPVEKGKGLLLRVQ
ncbi:glycoside hydrolase domain-containing protein [Pedobacter nutrimenti]|uniref:Glycoside hydrolase 123-like N-terminal domain-containing protein n=1 Tax=Pedobacter nutrimenti TaxID=1241337 RepID=A0A318UCA5_9SPHI|nr:glycoside hydrolase domain-containing protein [Pedobacter nutrimenti]PYF71582.1 hypothetical protein B0O44_107197 [Pedobacter nutrimenti]